MTQKMLGVKVDDNLERDILKACGGRGCSKSKYVKDAVIKQLAIDRKLSTDAARMTSGTGPCKTLNYTSISDEDETTGIIRVYDQTASFITHVLVPFTENGRKFYRDQNGYKWSNVDDEMPSPVWDDDGECKEIF